MNFDIINLQGKEITEETINEQDLQQLTEKIRKFALGELANTNSSKEYIYLDGDLSFNKNGKVIEGLGESIEDCTAKIFYYNVKGFLHYPNKENFSQKVLNNCKMSYEEIKEKLISELNNLSIKVTFKDLVFVTYGIINIACIPCDDDDAFMNNISLLKEIFNQL